MRPRALDHDRVARLYLAGRTVNQIAIATGYKPDSVRQVLRVRGLTGLRDDRYGNAPTRLPEATVATIRAMRADGVTYRAIAAALGVSTGTINRYTQRTDNERTS